MPSSGSPDAPAPMETPSCGWQSGASPPGTWAYSGSPTAAESGSQASRPIAGTAPREAGCGLPGTTAGPTPLLSPRHGVPSAPRSICAPGSCSERVMTLQLRERVPLAPYTTLGLGGPARYFHACTTEAELREALTAARERRLRVQIIGGGSNLVVADAGFPGVVLKVAIGGVTLHDAVDGVEVVAGAGVEWDALVRQAVARHGALERLEPGAAVRVVRDTVLELRRRKSMVLDPADPNARSVGSFFVNPVLSAEAFDELARRRQAAGQVDGIPTFPADGRVKVPAAWLIEPAGFAKGYRSGGVGVSTRHALAPANHGGTTTELLALAQSIARAVYERFGVRLEREPVVVG